MPEARSLDRQGSKARLWVCHHCELIGSEAQAESHMEKTGHRIDQLDEETTAGIHEEWKAWQLERAALLLAHRDRIVP